jgi:hypothetical protein
MKFMLRAAIAAASIGSIPPAIADESGPSPGTALTALPAITAQVPTQNVPSIATAQRGQAAVQTDTRPGHGPWLFPPIGKYLDQRAGG